MHTTIQDIAIEISTQLSNQNIAPKAVSRASTKRTQSHHRVLLTMQVISVDGFFDFTKRWHDLLVVLRGQCF